MLMPFLISCMSAQGFLPVKGTGEITQKDYSVSDFKNIDVSGGFDVTLVPGNAEGVSISAQPNLFEYIHAEVVQGVLKIYIEGNIIATRGLKARIEFKELNNLNVSGGGDVIAESVINSPELFVGLSGGGDLKAEINTAMFDCKVSGGGDVKIEGSAKKSNLNLSGGGDLEANIDAGTISCYLSGGGDLMLRCRETEEARIEVNGGGDVDAMLNANKMKCSVSGGGNAKLAGSALNLDINITGGGDVNASSLNSELAMIQASGGSDIHVSVSKELKGNISGGGDIYISGNPPVVSIDARGGSEVHRQ